MRLFATSVTSLPLLLSACVHTPPVPPPTRLADAYWWNGAGFSAGDRWVREGRFVARPAVESERVALGGRFACPIAGTARLDVGGVADFALFDRDPGDRGARIVAEVRGGHRVAITDGAASRCG